MENFFLLSTTIMFPSSIDWLRLTFFLANLMIDKLFMISTQKNIVFISFFHSIFMWKISTCLCICVWLSFCRLIVIHPSWMNSFRVNNNIKSLSKLFLSLISVIWDCWRVYTRTLFVWFRISMREKGENLIVWGRLYGKLVWHCLCEGKISSIF